MRASKTKGRTNLLKGILDVISSESIFETIDYRKKSEDTIKQFMYQPLVESFTKKFINDGMIEDKARDKAKDSIVWESHMQNTLHNMKLFGTYHRPDFEVKIDGLNVAIEIKKGSTGFDLRCGFGQGLMYQAKYDFTIYLFIDTSDDKSILKSLTNISEDELIDSIWNNYNILFSVV